MIPKTVHTFWFGGKQKPPHIERFLQTQRDILNTYRHVEWNEGNFLIDRYPAIREAAARGKWAHVSDYARLRILMDHGGIYMDTDVEVRRSFDPLLGHPAFIGYMWDCALGTAVIGAEPGHGIVGELLDIYEAPEFRMSLDTPNNDLFTRYFIDRVPGFRLDGQAWSSDQIAVLPKHAFEHPRFFNDDGYSIHHFDASWRPRSPRKALALKTVKRLMGLRGYRKYVCAKALRISPFSGEYVGRS